LVTTFLLAVFATVCAFLMGYSVNQGSTCAVTAAKQLVDHNQVTMLVGFAIAIGTAGLICLPLYWLSGGVARVAPDASLSMALIVGAVLLGIGAFINDACIFGTLSRIGQGEVRFFGLPIGLAIGFAIVDRQNLIARGPSIANSLTEFSFGGMGVVAVFGALLIGAWIVLGREQSYHRIGAWPLRKAMAVLGACGALLYALTPGWTYADAVRAVVVSGGAPTMISAGALVAAISALAGAIVSGIRANAFRFEPPTIVTLSRSIVGGAIMAFGGTLIPGGNDTLLLSSVPSATVSGITAYAIMSLTVPVLLLVRRRMTKV
jgi:uncharacterized protein